VRKLIEDVAVTDRLRSKSIEVAAYLSTRNEPVFLEVLMSDDLLQVEEHFDLQKPSGVRLSYSDLASEIIHADGFGWIPDESTGVQTFWVFSYRNALNRLLMIDTQSFIRLIDDVLKDKPTRWMMSKDLRTGRVRRHAE
jgi:hypothetical protein